MIDGIILGIWSGLGIFWWVLAWRLVLSARRPGTVPRSRERYPAEAFRSAARNGRHTPAEINGRGGVAVASPQVASDGNYGNHADESSARPLISIFKPLPLLGAEGLHEEEPGLESFIAQLDEQAEVLLGIHEADRPITAPFVERMRRKYPQARLEIVYRSRPDDSANPKISWQRLLAPHASGDLWLWSDADIVAPPGFLESARRDYEESGGMVTYPYVVREISSPQALLDTLFVNVEFYPGLLLLQRLGPVDFTLGSAALFSRADFESRADWKELGASLADDFVLGQQFQPVRLGSTTFVTSVDAPTWLAAVLHNLRWNKTVFWNRPLGFAGRIINLPVMGWLIYTILHPAQPLAWMGLLGMIQFDVIFAAIICRHLGCRLRVWNLLTMELWSLWRIGVWMACWLPGPVNWRGQLWWGPRKK